MLIQSSIPSGFIQLLWNLLVTFDNFLFSVSPYGFLLLIIKFDDICTLSGKADLSDLLTGMDGRITKAREHALSRKEILEKVEKWTLASEEESWLDEYERVP